MLTLLLVACGAASDKNDDTSGGTVGGTACAEWLPPVGSLLTYDFTAEYEAQYAETGGYTQELTSWDEGTGAFTLTIESHTEDVGGNYTDVQVHERVCDAEGMKALSFSVDWENDYGGVVTGHSDSTFDPPLLLVPEGVSVGDTWTSTWNEAYSNDQGAHTTYSFVYETVVTEAAEKTVTAGTFDTLVFQQTWDSAPTDRTEWHARGVGLIADLRNELVGGP